MAKRIRATRLEGNLLRGAFSLLSLGFESKADQRRIARLGDDMAEALEDGLSLEIDAKDDRVGIGVRRHRQPPTLTPSRKGARR